MLKVTDSVTTNAVRRHPLPGSQSKFVVETVASIQSLLGSHRGQSQTGRWIWEGTDTLIGLREDFAACCHYTPKAAAYLAGCSDTLLSRFLSREDVNGCNKDCVIVAGVVKVILVSPLPPPVGGIATWSVSILREMKRRSDVEIVHLDSRTRYRSLRDVNRFQRFVIGSLQAIRDTYRVYSAIRSSRPAVIHLCTSGGLATPKDILILFLARISRVGSIIHYRMGRLPEIVAANGCEWKITRVALKQADRVLLLDRKSEEAVRKAIPDLCVERIPNPIEIRLVREILSRDRMKMISEGRRRIVYVGNVIPAKGLRELVKACVLIEDIPVELDLVGEVDTGFRAELESLSAEKGSDNWLRFCGRLRWEETMGCILDADVFVLPSHTEGFPNVVLEAMALGKPIVSTRVGAIPEMLGENSEEECGIVVTPKDTLALRDALRDFLTHPEKTTAYGTLAQKKAMASYAMERVVELYVKLWRSLASENRS